MMVKKNILYGKLVRLKHITIQNKKVVRQMTTLRKVELSQKMAQKEPEKKMPSTAANAKKY